MRTLIITLALVLTACSSAPAAATPAPVTTAEPPWFDAAAVQASFVEECKDAGGADELLCLQVQVAGMSAEGDLLRVPTTLNAGAQGQGLALCEQLAWSHLLGRGMEGHLGFRHIGVMDKNGGDLAACSVD